MEYSQLEIGDLVTVRNDIWVGRLSDLAAMKAVGIVIDAWFRDDGRGYYDVLFSDGPFNELSTDFITRVEIT